MQENKQKVREFLNKNFQTIKVRETETGFRFNVQELNQTNIASLDSIPANVRVKIKRSGTGLVVIID